MSKIVFILGAGASAHTGAPLMHNFLDEASRIHRSAQLSEDAQEDFEIVFTAISKLQGVHSKSQLDINNLEAVFNAFETAAMIEKLPGSSPTEIASILNSFKQLIVHTIEQTTRFPVNGGYTRGHSGYLKFADLVSDIKKKHQPESFSTTITFNYDVCLDVALHLKKLSPDYGLSKQLRQSPLLLKLHGSINWARENSKSKILHAAFTRINRFIGDKGDPLWFSYKIGSKIQSHFAGQHSVESIPVIIPPAWNKADYHGQISKVWQRAAIELEEAEHIFIIGYSLPETDAFFKLLYALGTVGDTPLKRIEVFNPDQSGETEKRFRDLMGPGALARFKYHPLKFGEAIPVIRSYFK